MIAIGALGALWYARKTFLANMMALEDNVLSRRAILVPTPKSGTCKVGNDKKFKSIIFTLANYGVNPAIKSRGEIHCFVKKAVEDPQALFQLPFWSQDSYQSNPLPQKGEWKVEYLCKHSLSVDYIIYMLSYMDVTLNKRFEDIFYWKVENEKLVEVHSGTYTNLVRLAEIVEDHRGDLKNVPILYGED